MPLKVLIVPDKFKGTLTAQAAAAAIAKGWRQARPQDSLELLPMSDGGDGFGEVISQLVHAKAQTVWTLDAAGRRGRARWWWEKKTKTAIIESADVIGLAMLPQNKFHPFQLDTFGLGLVLRAASAKGTKRCLIGIGGSATNDGGFGLARALGWNFLDRNDRPIEHWTDLAQLAHLHAPRRTRWFESLIVAVDVQNPLLGASGATRIYGPQKGLRPEDFPLAEKCLRQLALATRKSLKRDLAKIPGAGAAGGLGFGLLAFLGAQPQAGFDLFVRTARLQTRLRSADLVITGEGAIDKSTLMGKGVGEIARRCQQLNVPCIGLAGVVNDSRSMQGRFTMTFGLTELTAAAQAKTKPAYWLEQLAMRVAHQWP
ncbi:MAG: glycerate kinase [Verrucomicrobia bacterium]|nr:glycerate kinase [Verrucomicrobiota bacterium]